eukprot:11181767-Ditylum_brightwellii.AAC.1
MNSNEIPLNGAIHNKCSTIHNVMESMAEAEVGSLYINCQHKEKFRTVLQEMGHPQPPHNCNNKQFHCRGIVNNCVKQCRTHAIDM